MSAHPKAHPDSDPVLTTPLNALHRELGGRMVPFEGYELPVQYPTGILKEHLHCRSAAGLFDVSHMGQARLWLKPEVAVEGDPAAVLALALEKLVPADLLALRPGRIRYTVLTNDQGGIEDDLLVTRCEDHLSLVVNAGTKEADYALIEAALSDIAILERLNNRAMLALQGPKAEEALARLAPGCRDLVFMSGAEIEVAGTPAFVTRSGYTGEDGFEIAVPATLVEDIARKLLAMEEVAPIGLGARDSLRLEAGLCLYGHDLTTQTTPVEGSLAWSIGKQRRQGGERAGEFPGASVILPQLEAGPDRLRVGIRPEGKAPVREGTAIYAAGSEPVGTITSGGFGPSLGGPVAMGYINRALAEPGTAITLEVRGKRLPAHVAALPFITPGYKR